MNVEDSIERCVSCNTPLDSYITNWLYKCKRCGLENSLLYNDQINGKDPIGWTESANDFLEELRERNARSILEELSIYAELKSKKLLDIGCAAGWFLGVAKNYHMSVIGVEPEKNIAEKAIKKGLDIRTVIFPDETLNNKKFDVITFNDVFEHIKHPDRMLEQVSSQLDDNGYLILNLPSSNGVIYKLSCLLARFSYISPLERLWQKGYFSPHLYYYSHRNLAELVQKKGFKLISKNRLDVIQIKGLWNRINHNKSMNIACAIIAYCSIVIAYPILKYLLPSDIMFHIYQKS
ncbi:MAG: class I SAM-dependent methyltransferase [Gammaproteobacteria bacterium]|jgi:2-polyprenyl-3-methyl-5-hydroxy-6-metoxy-1,4-benzoquinol methylase